MKTKILTILLITCILLCSAAPALAKIEKNRIRTNGRTIDKYDMSNFGWKTVTEKGRGSLVFQKAPGGSFMKSHTFRDGDSIYVNLYYRDKGYAFAYDNGEYGYVDASYIDWGSQDNDYSYNDYDDFDDGEPYITLVFPNGARGEWKKGKSGSLLMRVKPTNISSYRTVTAFELYMYAEDVWGRKIYGSNYYYATTKKKIKPGESGWSDYMSLPNRSEIHKVYVGISQVKYEDSMMQENDNIQYASWTVD